MSFRKFLNDNKIAIVMRGLPGAGKSYKVRQLLVKFGGDEDHVFSADKYFNNLAKEDFTKRYGREPNQDELNDNYKRFWHPSKLGAAHRYCLDKFKEAVDLGLSPVIVDNTNTRLDQMEHYFKYAEDHGYKIRVEEPESAWWANARSELGKTQIQYSKQLQDLRDELLAHGQHGVPKDALERLINNTWQNIPKYSGGYLTYDQVFGKQFAKH